MGRLRFFSQTGPAVQRLPSGSMTVDRAGNVVATTVPSTYPVGMLREIAKEILAIFREASAAQMPLSEFNLHFASFRITAREMRGGAIIFLSPKTSFKTASST